MEFLGWMATWSTWDVDKFISYLDLQPHCGLPRGNELFRIKLEMDLRFTSMYSAGFNNGDLIKSILNFIMCPIGTMHYPVSTRTY